MNIKQLIKVYDLNLTYFQKIKLWLWMHNPYSAKKMKYERGLRAKTGIIEPSATTKEILALKSTPKNRKEIY